MIRKNGIDQTLTLRGVKIGRLLPPDGTQSTYAFELELPPRLYSTLVAAQIIYEGVQREREVREQAEDGIDDNGGIFVPTGGAT